MMRYRRSLNARGICISIAVLSWFALPASATNLVLNGDFSQTSSGPGQFNTTTTTLTNWSSSGYNFVFASGTADTTGSYTPTNSQYLKLWGPNDGSANGLPASSPYGGNFIGADGAYEVGAITQTISGLTSGDFYTVGFYWAGAQQSGFTGPNTEQWQVSLGSSTKSTVVLNNVSEGFTGWQYQTFTYQATSSSEVLSFLAVGTPSGQPPFSLLADVSLVQTPEPATVVFVAGGFAMLAGLGLRRRQAKTPVPPKMHCK
jgi:hypothetical protein